MIKMEDLERLGQEINYKNQPSLDNIKSVKDIWGKFISCQIGMNKTECVVCEFWRTLLLLIKCIWQ